MIYKPETREELDKLILKAIKKDGYECDLSFIDTSLITDMSCLFMDFPHFNGTINNNNIYIYLLTFLKKLMSLWERHKL